MAISAEILINDLEEEFENLEKGKIKSNSNFRDFFEWNSINALMIMVMVSTNYGVKLLADDMYKVTVIQDMVDIINTRIEEEE